MNNEKRILTEGSILKSLVALSVPIIFANILQTAYQLIDTFWVGRLGSEAVAAVSISFPIFFFLMSIGGGFAMAGSILVAQYKGAENKQKVDHVAAQTMLVGLVMAVFITFAGYFLSPLLLRLMGAEESVLNQAVSYLQISFIGIIFLFAYFVFQSLMRGVGDVKTPVYIVFGTVLLNLILDPLFIFGWGVVPAFGVAGAALATVATQGIASIVGLLILFSGKYDVRIRMKDLKYDKTLIKKMFSIGLPASIEQSTRALGMTVMAFLVASFGTVTIAAYGIGSRIMSFIIIPTLGLSMATSTLVGQNIGANKLKRARKIVKISSFIGFIILFLVGILLFLFAQQLATFFVPDSPQTIQMSTQFIRIMAFSFGFIALQQTLNGAFRGAGNTFATMIMSIISLWILQFPLAYILSKHTSLEEVGIWYAFPISNVIAAIITLIWYRVGLHKGMKMTIKEKEVIKEMKIEEGDSAP